MSWNGDFLSAEDRRLAEQFERDGYLVLDAADRPALDALRDRLVNLACNELGCTAPDDPEAFLDKIHERVLPTQLNDFRLALIRGVNATPWARAAYHAIARDALASLVGNELAMQRRLNLSIQLPEDDSSLLPVHSDVWAGDSPFEVVVWIPFVDVFGTKTMFLLPPEPYSHFHDQLHRHAATGAEGLYKAIEPELVWLEAKYGQFILFNQTLPHGNRINREPTTRWTMNCRFKGVFTPYSEKTLGEFFEPITLRAASRVGMEYSLPDGFDG